MLPEDHRRIQRIFAEATELPASERDAFVRQACAGLDEGIRHEVEALLRAFDEPDPLFDGQDWFYLEPAQQSENQTVRTGDCVGRFEILRLIGKGGMGEVYEAQDLHFSDRVALKTIRSEFLTRADFAARFRREIQLARKVTHPNVCRVYDVGRDTVRNSEIAYLTMELLAGETLQARMRHGSVPADEAIGLLRQMAHGLAALHAAQVIHRDFKPANVSIVQSPQGPRVVITDFGLAHAIETAPAGDSVTIAGEVLGTPAYMAPRTTHRRNGWPPNRYLCAWDSDVRIAHRRTTVRESKCIRVRVGEDLAIAPAAESPWSPGRPLGPPGARVPAARTGRPAGQHASVPRALRPRRRW